MTLPARRLPLAALALAAALLPGCASAPPEEEPEAVAEPAPTTAPAPTREIRVASTNLREAPGLEAKVLGTLAKGERVELSGACADGWCEVVLADGRRGFVAERNLVDPARPKPAPAKKGKKPRCERPESEPELLSDPILSFSDAGPHGAVTIELTVDATGVPRKAKVVSNATGSPELAKKAEDEARALRFRAPTRSCKAVPFIWVWTRDF